MVDAVCGDVVDDDPADLQPFERRPRVGQIVGEDARLESVAAVVDRPHGVGELTERRNHDQRRKGLGAANPGRGWNVGQDRGGVVGTVGGAAEEHFPAHRSSLVDPGRRSLDRRRVHHRTDVRRGIERIAHLQAVRRFHETADEIVPDVLVDEDTLDAYANLAGIAECPDDNAPDGPIEVRRAIDDDSGVAAEFEYDTLLAGACLHLPADLGTAGEGQQLEALV